MIPADRTEFWQSQPGDDDDPTCPTCKGDGEVYVVDGLAQRADYLPCGDCDGLGTVPSLAPFQGDTPR